MPDYSGYLHMDEEHTRRDLGEDELVSRLREEAEAFGGSSDEADEGNVLATLFIQAADRIEALEAEVARLSQVR